MGTEDEEAKAKKEAEAKAKVDAEAKEKGELGDAGKKALDAERKARRDAERKASDLESRLKELEDKDKSEVEKLRGENAELTKQVAEGGLKGLRAEVALEKGLSAAQAKRLVGSTKEELDADADEILESFPVAAGGGGRKPPPTTKPVTDLKGGTTPEDEPDETDPRKLAERIDRL